MIIRSEQYASFEELAWKNFLRRAVEHLRQDMAGYTEGLDDEHLIARIECAVELAAEYELFDEQAVVSFLDAGFLLDDVRFAENPRFAPIRVILEDKELPPHDRAEQVLTLAFQQVLIG